MKKKKKEKKKIVVGCNDKEIMNIKVNWDTEKVLLQRIIDELNDRIVSKDNESVNLKKKKLKDILHKLDNVKIFIMKKNFWKMN